MALSICALASGSSGNSFLIASPSTRILVDAGLPAAEITNRLHLIGHGIESIDAILLTHAHADHYRSAGTLSYRHKIPVFAPPGTIESIRNASAARRYRKLSSPEGIPPSLHDIEIEAFPVIHGGPERNAGEPVGFVFRSGNSSAAVATDLGTVTEEVRSAIRGANAIVVEANYDAETLDRKLGDPSFRGDWEYLRWVQSDYGHLSNDQCAELIASAVTRETTDVLLAHLSENHREPRRDNNGYELACETVTARLQAEGLPLPKLHRTHRRGLSDGEPSTVVEIAD